MRSTQLAFVLGVILLQQQADLPSLDFSILLIPADIERDAEQELLDRQPAAALSADVLVSPHHGSKTSSTEAFLAAVNPSVSIFTVGYRNRFGHPKEEIVDHYRAINSRL